MGALGHALCAPLVAVRVVRELGCPGKIVPSSPDPGVARFELTEPLGPVSTRRTLRRSYVLHVGGAEMGSGSDRYCRLHAVIYIDTVVWGRQGGTP